MGAALEALRVASRRVEREAIIGASGSDSIRNDLPGPFAVGRYAEKLQEEMRRRARVLLIGEVTGFGRSRVQAYFELRDPAGALPCAIWLNDLERAALPEGGLRDGVEVVIAGGPDYYPGGGAASPKFCFRATHLRLAGEGDLLNRLAALREQLRGEGLFELQRKLPRPLLPRTIGVITAESGAARRDLGAALGRRGWAGTVIWAFAPVQDRHAAPAITAAIRELAARPEIEVIVLTRGGGSLSDLWAFCDETLCRTVAMLRVPVLSAIGHERDSTLLDDVAALSCSTPTHAAEAAVRVDCAAARRNLGRYAGSMQRAADRILVRGAARHWAERLQRSALAAIERRRSSQRQIEVTLRAQDPRRTLERGYALAENAAGEPLTSAAAALEAGDLGLRFADGRVWAKTRADRLDAGTG